MKLRATRFQSQRRPLWWSALVSLAAVLSLLLTPPQVCAVMELLPDQAHTEGHSHAAVSIHQHDGDGHTAPAVSVNDHPHAATHQAAWQSVPDEHDCCSNMDAAPVVAASSVRAVALDAHTTLAAFAPAIVPSSFDIFALTNCHGRDGPLPDESLHFQLSRATLLGRAPPVSV